MDIKKNVRQFVLYLIVGGCATVVEWIIFYLLGEKMQMHYVSATAVAFAISTFANWLIGKILLFGERQNVFRELAKVYLTSIVGLLMNVFIMWVAVDVCNVGEMLSKMIATGIVFFWNFLVRKFLIYKV